MTTTCWLCVLVREELCDRAGGAAHAGRSWAQREGKACTLTFQSHGFHLGGLTLITLQLPFRNRRGFPQVEKGTPAAHRRLFHFILRPPPRREKMVYIKTSERLPLLTEGEHMMERASSLQGQGGHSRHPPSRASATQYGWAVPLKQEMRMKRVDLNSCH